MAHGGSAVAQLREMQSMTLAELEFRTGLSLNTLRRAEEGKKISRASAEQLLGVLDHPHTHDRRWPKGGPERLNVSRRHHRLVLRLERQWGIVCF